MKSFKMETPNTIDELKKIAADKTSYKNRLQAVDSLGEYKCQQSKDILWRLMMNDKVYEVQEAAFRKLQAFGEDVKLPRKKKGHLVKDINKKLGKVRDSLSGDFTANEFNQKFLAMYPVEFDIYSLEKKGKFNSWIAKVLASLPKK